MKLAVAGATGRIGGGLTREALAQGHHVVALVRTPEKLKIEHENLTVSSISPFLRSVRLFVKISRQILLTQLSRNFGPTISQI